MAAISAAEVVRPIPGTLSMISASSVKRGVAWIMAAIAASNLTSSTVIVFKIRACIRCTAAGSPCSPWLSSLDTLQCLTRIYHLMKLLARLIVGLAASFVEGLGEPGNHLGIDRVIL